MSLIPQPDTTTLFSLYSRVPLDDKHAYRGAPQPQWIDSKLSLAYFSSKNIQTLQNGIQLGVYERSNGKYQIGTQDPEALRIIMKSIYLTNANSSQINITNQIKVLNQLVLDYCVPQVFGEAQGYMQYLEDSNTLVVPIDRPVQTDVKNKSLSEKFWF